jgi:hypothetical protein
MSIKPEPTHSLPIQLSEQGANPDNRPSRKGYASAGRGKICLHIFESGGVEFNNPVQVSDPDGS